MRIAMLILTALLAGPALGADSGAPDGQRVYSQGCIVCHGANGKGALPGVPDFTQANGPLSKADALLVEHVITGFQSPGSPMAMPPKGGNPKLTREEIQQVVNYIRTTFGH